MDLPVVRCWPETSLLKVPKFTTPFLQVGLMQMAFAGLWRVGAEGAAVNGSANVPRPSASALIWQNPKSTLRHPMHRPRQRASVVCAARTPTQLEGSGWWGARRSGIKKEAEGRVTAAELSAPSARSSRHDEGLWRAQTRTEAGQIEPASPSVAAAAPRVPPVFPPCRQRATRYGARCHRAMAQTSWSSTSLVFAPRQARFTPRFSGAGQRPSSGR